MKNLQAKCIILRKTNFSEYDVIFDVLTSEGKMIGFFARGARKMKSKFSGVLQVGHVVDISYSTGKNLNYPTEISIDKENLFSFYSKSIENMNFYVDVITIVRAVAKDLEDERLFETVLTAFQKADEGEDLVEIYNQFLTEVLEIIEVDIRLKCYYSGELIKEKEFYYSPDSNRVISIDKKPNSIDLPKISFDKVFYKNYLQKLILEHVHAKIRLKL